MNIYQLINIGIGGDTIENKDKASRTLEIIGKSQQILYSFDEKVSFVFLK